MEKKKKKTFYKKWWFVALVIIIVIGALGSGEDTPKEPAKQAAVNSNNEVNAKAEEPSKKEIESTNETLSQKNAVGKTKEYLNVMSFSKSGLITQLEFEGFENEDAVYAVNKIDVDWNEQALKKGKEYLDIMSYSRTGLIEQLEFEGFSKEEATYAVDEIGL